MDNSQSALDSLRTVEFRETLKGYHRDDVDEYLEKAAVEAEGLQEQLRQSGERLRQAGERIAQLESQLEQRPETSQPAEPAVADDTLQRTLLLAQQFVDQTKSDAEAQAAKLLAEAEAHARGLTTDAEARASQIAIESERKLKDEINRLEGIRCQLSGDVETLARHLEAERSRLRTALGEVLQWVEENVQPAGALTGQRPAGSSSAQTPTQAPTPAQRPTASPAAPAAPATPGPSSPVGPSGSPAVRTVDPSVPTGQPTRAAGSGEPTGSLSGGSNGSVGSAGITGPSAAGTTLA